MRSKSAFQMLWFLCMMFVIGIPVWTASGPHARSSSLRNPEEIPGKQFNIGFLLEGTDFGNNEGLFEDLKHHLWKQGNIRSAFVKQGYREIILSRCDSHKDMVQRLDVGEFDMAFATAVIYAWQNNPAYREPLLVTQRPGDFKQPNNVAGASRRGVVIFGPGCPLFGRQAADPSSLKKLLEESPLAVPSSYSAAGYISPHIRMGRDMGNIRPAQYWFCGSDTEVVEHVITGLVPFGACREDALRQVLGGNEGALELILENKMNPFCRIWWRTKSFPTDPVLLHEMHKPEKSGLGTELKAGLRLYFNRGIKLPGVKLISADERGYLRLSRDLADWLKTGDFYRNPPVSARGGMRPELMPQGMGRKSTGTNQPENAGDGGMSRGKEDLKSAPGEDRPSDPPPVPAIPDDEFSYDFQGDSDEGSPWAG